MPAWQCGLRAIRLWDDSHRSGFPFHDLHCSWIQDVQDLDQFTASVSVAVHSPHRNVSVRYTATSAMPCHAMWFDELDRSGQYVYIACRSSAMLKNDDCSIQQCVWLLALALSPFPFLFLRHCSPHLAIGVRVSHPCNSAKSSTLQIGY